MTDKTITIGTRGSKLALWQAEKVRALIQATFPEVHCAVKVIRTKGDKILDVALSKIGDKGLFTKELERCLLEGEVDVCVHSMKDMPTVLPEGLFIAGVTERACPNDVIVASAKGLTLSDLPADARVATGSLRRVAQLARLRPDVTACEIRGNIDTRIGRVLAGEFARRAGAAEGGVGQVRADLVGVLPRPLALPPQQGLVVADVGPGPGLGELEAGRGHPGVGREGGHALGVPVLSHGLGARLGRGRWRGSWAVVLSSSAAGASALYGTGRPGRKPRGPERPGRRRGGLPMANGAVATRARPPGQRNGCSPTHGEDPVRPAAPPAPALKAIQGR